VEEVVRSAEVEVEVVEAAAVEVHHHLGRG
jgi:hypothetical protein